MHDQWLAGVDGCTGGWVAVFVNLNRTEPPRVRFATNFADVVNAKESPVVVAVDMPIGLPDRIEGKGRAAEQAVRPLLGNRGCCVFSIPSRPAVEAEANGFEEAKRIARSTSRPPRAFAIQARGIFNKIREIDVLLRERPELVARVFEVHPEVAFWKLNSERPVSTSKRKLAGRNERIGLLSRSGVSDEILTRRPPDGARQDDFIDAIVSSVIAERIHARVARPFPNPPQHDRFGLPIAIWA